MKLPARTPRPFPTGPAKRVNAPLFLGIMGPSGGGKTYSALRLASGIREVVGGEIEVIDTEGEFVDGEPRFRALHYADAFRFRHTPFAPPYGSLDYLDALREAQKRSSVVVVDSMSHEHEGEGGLLDYQEKELDRLTEGKKASDRDRYNMLAWQNPKAARKALLAHLRQTPSYLIACFRGKRTNKLAKNEKGETEFIHMGFMPIAGEEFVFETTACFLLMPGADGHPTWHPEYPGERMMMKLPAPFRDLLLTREQPLDEEVGRKLAEWARPGGKGAAPGAPPREAKAPRAAPTSAEVGDARWCPKRIEGEPCGMERGHPGPCVPTSLI